MSKIDPTDRRILHQMQQDADISIESLGERIGLSRNACWRRIRALQDQGIIKARVALLDANKLNLGLTVFIQMRTDRHDTNWMEKFAAATRSLPEILGVYRMTGDLDYLVKAKVADVAAYDRLYRRLVSKVSISDVTASFVMEEIKETTALPVL